MSERQEKVPILVAKILKQTNKSIRVIYINYENPAEFSVLWLPKTLASIESGIVLIPNWLKANIARDQQRYTAKTFVNPKTGLQDYAYGFGPYYDSRGSEVDLDKAQMSEVEALRKQIEYTHNDYGETLGDLQSHNMDGSELFRVTSDRYHEEISSLNAKLTRALE